MVTTRKEGEEGAETHETRNLAGGPPTSSLASPLRSVSADQDINDDAQPFVSQVEGVTTIGLAVASRDDYVVLLQDPGEEATLLG